MGADDHRYMPYSLLNRGGLYTTVARTRQSKVFKKLCRCMSSSFPREVRSIAGLFVFSTCAASLLYFACLLLGVRGGYPHGGLVSL